MEPQWIPILDYAVLKGVSTSTLRRYIKANKIQYKIENGRYLLRSDTRPRSEPISRVAAAAWDSAGAADGISVFQRVRELEDKVLQAEEQIAELKMLVAIYEEKLGARSL
jgi:hypothetical protein